MSDTKRLLQDGDPPAVGTENADGTSPILLVSDHAGRAIPKALGTLGLDEAALSRHIAYDIGIYGVTTRLARALGATYVYQTYSRLVIDCNRRPENSQSIMVKSDGTRVPGNHGLSQSEIAARHAEILEPYHREIERVLGERDRRGHPGFLVSMHSCTPVFGGEAGPRLWHIGVLAAKAWRLGDALIALLKRETAFCIGRKQPYRVNVESDYAIPVHGEAVGLPYIEIEIRQDLIAHETRQQQWAELCAGILPHAVKRAGVPPA